MQEGLFLDHCIVAVTKLESIVILQIVSNEIITQQ